LSVVVIHNSPDISLPISILAWSLTFPIFIHVTVVECFVDKESCKYFYWHDEFNRTITNTDSRQSLFDSRRGMWISFIRMANV
jgi:hypothetical protein